MKLFSGVSFSLLAILSGCAGEHNYGDPGLGVPTAYTAPTSPLSAHPGATVLLIVEVTQSPGSGRTLTVPKWVVRESDGGVIAPKIGDFCDDSFRTCANYTAPGTPGTYHIDVQDKNFNSVKTTVTITVAP